MHRALIRGLKLGDDGLTEAQAGQFKAIGEQISMTERAAMAAERDAIDRMTAAYLSDQVGTLFVGRVNGVTRFGLFVTLIESGADGLVPISTLPDDFYVHDERQHCLVGRRWGRRYRLGETLTVRLAEADRTTGGLVLHLAEPDDRDEERSGGAAKAKSKHKKASPTDYKKSGNSKKEGLRRTPQARRARVRRRR